MSEDAKFKREQRYWAVKCSKLTSGQNLRVAIMVDNLPEDAQPECVVVESDWAIYEDVWTMVQVIAGGGDRLEAAKALLEQHGLAAVPLEPTEAMVDAALSLCDDESINDDEWCQTTYKAMIAEAQK